MAGQRDALLTVRPDAEDLIQLDRHEDAHAADGEVHEHHLPARTKFERIVQQRADFLEEVGLFNPVRQCVL